MCIMVQKSKYGWGVPICKTSCEMNMSCNHLQAAKEDHLHHHHGPDQLQFEC